MKLLESTRFEAINNALSITTGDSTISGRIESYSCKLAGGDKAMYKRFSSEQGSRELQALSPPQTQLGMSPGQGYYSKLNSAITELEWSSLSKIQLCFNLKIIPDISESLLLYNSSCRKTIFIPNIKQCLENNSIPKCQYLALTCSIKDCVSRFAWLSSSNSFYCENVVINNVFAVHSCANSVVLLNVVLGRVKLLLFDIKSKSVVCKKYVTDVKNANRSKLVLNDAYDRPGSSHKKIECEYDGFILLNGDCYKFNIKDNNISLNDHQKFGNILDIIFSTNNEYFLLTEHSNLYIFKDDKFMKIISVIDWKTYCLIEDGRFLVSDHKNLYLCDLEKDHKLRYNQMPLQLVTSIVFYKDLQTAVCVNAQNRFYKIKTENIDSNDIEKKTLTLDIDNIESTVRLSKEIVRYSNRIDEVCEKINKQNAIIKDLAAVSYSNILKDYFSLEFRVDKFAEFQKYYALQKLEIHPDMCSLLSKSNSHWFYKTLYLDNNYDFIHEVYNIPKTKNTIKITSECAAGCKRYELSSSIQKILLDDHQKIGVRIRLAKNLIKSENMLSANNILNDDVYDTINQMALFSNLPTDTFKIKTNLKTYLKCSREITDQMISELFSSEFCEKLSDGELRINMNGAVIGIKIDKEFNRIEMFSNKMSTLNHLKKYLIQKSHSDSGIMHYDSRDRLRIENALRLLKTEVLNTDMNTELLCEVRERIRRISSQFINI